VKTQHYFQPLFSAVASAQPMRQCGKVSEVIGLLIESIGPTASVGDVCLIERKDGPAGRAEVVGFRKNRTLLMP
jgi:flagellum-specific ATP synthase